MAACCTQSVNEDSKWHLVRCWGANNFQLKANIRSYLTWLHQCVNIRSCTFLSRGRALALAVLYYTPVTLRDERSSSPRLIRRREERGLDTFYCTTMIVSLSLIKLCCEVVFKFACKLYFKLWRWLTCDKTQIPL